MLVDAFAKRTIGVGWFNRECTPLGVRGLVEWDARGWDSHAVRCAGKGVKGLRVSAREKNANFVL